MTPEQVIIKLLAGNISDSDVQCMLDIATRKLEEEWEVSDIIKYLRWTEHFDDWNEDYACKRMAEISDKYKKNKS